MNLNRSRQKKCVPTYNTIPISHTDFLSQFFAIVLGFIFLFLQYCMSSHEPGSSLICRISRTQGLLFTLKSLIPAAVDGDSFICSALPIWWKHLIKGIMNSRPIHYSLANRYVWVRVEGCVAVGHLVSIIAKCCVLLDQRLAGRQCSRATSILSCRER